MCRMCRTMLGESLIGQALPVTFDIPREDFHFFAMCAALVRRPVFLNRSVREQLLPRYLLMRAKMYTL